MIMHKPAPHAKKLQALAPTHVRVASSCGGALLTSLVLTPLDVVKTRLQAQSSEPCIKPGMTAARCSLCEQYIFDNGLMEHVVDKSRRPFFSCFRNEVRMQGMTDGVVKIFRSEGFRGLYSGLTPTLIMAVPSTVTYFTLYDWLRDKLSRWEFLNDVTTPLLAGSTARSFAATLIAPLELIRTQHQAATRGTSVNMMTSFQNNSHPSRGGLRSLWRGLVPTLWRDVPFSALYWLGYEQLRNLMAQPDVEDSAVMGFLKSFVAGAGSGLIASSLTHPFDVAKTRAQLLIFASQSHTQPNAASLDLSVTPKPSPATTGSSIIPRPAAPSTVKLLRDIVRTEGVKGLYVGVLPRLAKVAPSCAIMISAYEGGKELYRRHVRKEGQSGAWN